MAYDGSRLHALIDSIGGGSLRAYFYGPVPDDFETITGASYITDAVKRGLRENDIVHVYGNGPETARDLIVGTIHDDGSATLVDPGFISLTATASKPEAEAGTASNKLMTPERTDDYFQYRKANQEEAEAGTAPDKWLSAEGGKQHVDSRIADTPTSIAGESTDTVLSPAGGRAAIIARGKLDRANLLDYATSDTQRHAVRTGSVAIDALWADAKDDAAASGLVPILLPGGNYEVEPDARLDNPGLLVQGEFGKTIIHKNGQNSLFRVMGNHPNVANGFALASDVAANANSVMLDTGLGSDIVVGEIYVLLSEAAIFTGNTGKRGEFVHVRGVSGDVVTFWGHTKMAYAVVNSAKLVPVNFVHGAGFRDIIVDWDINSEVTSSNSFQELFPFDLRFAFRPELENIAIKHSLAAGIVLHGCYQAQIRNYRAKHFGSNTTGTDDPSSTDGLPGFGYAIREDGINQGLVAAELSILNCRSGYDTTAGYSARFNYGEPTGSVIGPGVHVDGRQSAFGIHWPGEGITFQSLTGIGGSRAGIVVRARRTKVNGALLMRCRGPAVWVRGAEGADPNLRGDWGVFENVHAIETNLGEELYGGGQDWRERGAFIDEGFNNTWINYSAERCGGPLYSGGHNGILRRPILKNGFARDMCQLAVTNKSVIHVANANTNANIIIDGLVSHSTDGKVVDLIRRATADSSGSPIRITAKNVEGVGHTGRIITSASHDRGLSVPSGSLSMLGRPEKMVLFDDFTSADLDGWSLQKGSDASAGLPAYIPASSLSAVRLETGNHSTGTMAVNGSQLNGRQLWRIDKGNLVFEAVAQVAGLAGNVCFFGLSSNGINFQMPAELDASDVLTPNAVNFVGFLFDSIGTNNWFAVAAKGSDVTNRKVNTGVAPSGLMTLRCEVAANGDARFYINGALVASIADTASATVVMAVLAAAYCRTTTDDRFFDVDYIFIEQGR